MSVRGSRGSSWSSPRALQPPLPSASPQAGPAARGPSSPLTWVKSHSRCAGRATSSHFLRAGVRPLPSSTRHLESGRKAVEPRGPSCSRPSALYRTSWGEVERAVGRGWPHRGPPEALEGVGGASRAGPARSGASLAGEGPGPEEPPRPQGAQEAVGGEPTGDAFRWPPRPQPPFFHKFPQRDALGLLPRSSARTPPSMGPRASASDEEEFTRAPGRPSALEPEAAPSSWLQVTSFAKHQLSNTCAPTRKPVL